MSCPPEDLGLLFNLFLGNCMPIALCLILGMYSLHSRAGLHGLSKTAVTGCAAVLQLEVCTSPFQAVLAAELMRHYDACMRLLACMQSKL